MQTPFHFARPPTPPSADRGTTPTEATLRTPCYTASCNHRRQGDLASQ